jgi:DNA-binding transcriptional LysR family regulator
MTASTSDRAAAYRRKGAVKVAGGTFICACGLFLAWLAWSQATTDRAFSLKAALIGPAFVALGLGVALLPGYREERLARGEDISRLQGWRLITPRWWAVVAVGFALGAAWAWFLARGPIGVLPLPTWR